jgi:hypothetical protein
MKPTLRFLPASLFLLSWVGLSGCTTGLGPRAIRNERPDYNQQIVRSADEQMLLNLVRIRYNDTPLFLELGSVVTSYGLDAAVSASGQINTGSVTGQANMGTGLSYYEHPTITYTPLMGDQFAERLLSPIPLDSIMLFSQSGWSAERLLLVTVLRINDLFNVPAATGPTPDLKPDYEKFLDFSRRFHSLQNAGLIGLNWERQGHETNAPGRDPHFWISAPSGPESALAADVLSVRRSLDLKPGVTDFKLTAFPFKRSPEELGIRCRSLMGVLYFLATAVEPPAPHAREGLVTVTRDAQGHPFDWKQFTGEVMTVHSQPEHPKNAAVAVKYRGWWFYIADNDQNSKITFSLLNTLFQLQATTGTGKSPLLTLPVGG